MFKESYWVLESFKSELKVGMVNFIIGIRHLIAKNDFESLL